MEQAELFTAKKVRKPRTEEQREYDRKWRASRSEEQKERDRASNRKWRASRSEEQKEEQRKKRRKWYASRSEERKEKQREYDRKWKASRSEEQKERDRASNRKWWTSLPEEQKERDRASKREWYASRSEEQKQRDRESKGRYLERLDLDGLRLLKIQSMCRSARYRAEKKILPFNLTQQDIADVWPKDDYCPALRIPLRVRPGSKIPTNNSPNLDRIIPRLGYVKGNIAVVSKLANSIMSSARPSEVIKVGKWFDEKYYEVKDKLNV